MGNAPLSIRNYAIIHLFNTWIDVCVIRQERSLLDSIDGCLYYVFSDENTEPGFGLESGGALVGYFDDEYMVEEGLDFFDRGESFVVYFEDEPDMKFPCVQYTREEIYGWFSLVLNKLKYLYPEFSAEICRLESRYYVAGEALKALPGKLDGHQPWFYFGFDKILGWRNVVVY